MRPDQTAKRGTGSKDSPGESSRKPSHGVHGCFTANFTGPSEPIALDHRNLNSRRAPRSAVDAWTPTSPTPGRNTRWMGARPESSRATLAAITTALTRSPYHVEVTPESDAGVAFPAAPDRPGRGGKVPADTRSNPPAAKCNTYRAAASGRCPGVQASESARLGHPEEGRQGQKNLHRHEGVSGTQRNASKLYMSLAAGVSAFPVRGFHKFAMAAPSCRSPRRPVRGRWVRLHLMQPARSAWRPSTVIQRRPTSFQHTMQNAPGGLRRSAECASVVSTQRGPGSLRLLVISLAVEERPASGVHEG